MTTATLSIRLVIPHYSESELDLQVDYAYYPRDQELEIQAVMMDVDGVEISVEHHLTATQRGVLVEECREDYYARMESAMEDRQRARREDEAWA